MQIVLDQAQCIAKDMAGVPGGKIIECQTEQGIQVLIPLDANAAKVVAAALVSGLIIASGPLPPPNRPNGGRSN